MNFCVYKICYFESYYILSESYRVFVKYFIQEGLLSYIHIILLFYSLTENSVLLDMVPLGSYQERDLSVKMERSSAFQKTTKLNHAI